METYHNTQIGVKIRLVNSFRLLLLLLVFVGTVSIMQMKQLADSTESLYHHPYTVSTATLRIARHISHMHQLLESLSHAENLKTLQAIFQTIENHHQEVTKEFTLVKQQFLGNTQQVIAAQQAFSAMWEPIQQQILNSNQRHDFNTIHQQLQEYHEHEQKIEQLEQLVAELTTVAHHKAALFLQTAQQTRDQTIMFMLALIVGCVLLSWFLIRAIRLPLGHVVNMLSSASTQIAATISQQERITAQQAASITETTTTMEELGTSSRQAAEQAEQAATETHKTLELAQHGTVRVDETLQSMTTAQEKVGHIAQRILSLSEQTGQIRTITDLVSDFANETRMLAMNSAVEAVRAGEHGKGFAVLAVETRKLADESKLSAGRINTLISDIQKATDSTVMATEEGNRAVESGMQTSHDTAETFQDVARSIGHVSEGAQQISLNVRQQSTAIRQVTEAIQAINTGAKEAATGLSQVKTGVQALNDAAQTLKKMI